MDSKKKVIATEAFLPGEYIQDAMNELGWSQDDLSEVMGCSRQHISRLINGKTAITADSALMLAAAFGTSADLWMNLQTSFELSKATKEDSDIRRRAEIYSLFPVRDVSRRGWISNSKDVEELEGEICRFLDVQSIRDNPTVAFAARKSGTYEEQSPSQIFWFCRAKKLANAVQAVKFDQSNWEPGIKTLLKLAATGADVRKVPRVLAEMGIRFLVVEHLPKSKIDGAAFWVDGSPVIALSLRYDRIDNFWFTLMHELVHIKYRDEPRVDVDICSEQSGGGVPEIEKRANWEASGYLVDHSKLKSFVARNRHMISQSKIVQFAQARMVHPGIIVGLLHGMGPDVLDFRFHRKLLVKVRESVVESSLTDGWGRQPILM